MHDPILTPPPGDIDPPPAPPPRRRRRGGLWLGLLLLALLLWPGYWLTSTPTGFATLWQWAGHLSQGRLQVGRSEGTLWGGFRLHALRWQGDTPLQLSSLQVRWQPSALWQRTLQIDELALGDLTLGSSRPGVPPQAPASLTLPLAVHLDRLTLRSLSLPAAPQLLTSVVARYRYQSRQHTLQLSQLMTPWGQGDGEATLADRAPFALGGRVSFNGSLDGVAAGGGATLRGSLLAPAFIGQAAAQGVLVDLRGELAPFEAVALKRLRRLDVRLGNINPHTLLPGWPQGKLSLAIQLAPQDADTVSGGLSLSNSDAGPVSAGKLPLSLLWGEFRIQGDTLHLPGIQAQLAGGEVRLHGRAAANALALDLSLNQLDSRGLDASLPSHRLGGSVQVAGTPRQPQLLVKLASGELGVESRLRLAESPRRLELSELLVRTGAGRFQGEGGLVFDSRTLRFNGRFLGFDPARLDPRWPAGSVNGTLDSQAVLGAQPQGKLALRLADSRLSGAALGGTLLLDWQPGRVQGLQADLSLGRNRLQGRGAFGLPGDTLQLQLSAPELGLLGPAFAGELQANAELAGTPQRPALKGTLQAKGLRVPGGITVANLQGTGETGFQSDSPFRVELQGRGVQAAGESLDELAVQAGGVRASHQLKLEARGSWQGKAQTLALQLQGGLAPDTLHWQGTLNSLQATGAMPLRLEAPVALQWAADQAGLAASRWQALGTVWQLGDTRWQRGVGWAGSGRVNGLALAALSPWLVLPGQNDLVVGAEWSLAGGQGWPHGQLLVQREQGDLRLPLGRPGAEPLQLSTALLQVGLGEAAPFRVRVDTRFGQLAGDGTLALPAGGSPGEARLAGRVTVSMPQLAVMQAWLAPGMEIGGALAADLQLGGTLSAPLLDGGLSGQGLRFAERKNGLRLEQGLLVARLQQRRIVVDKLAFGAQEALTARGTLSLDGDPAAAVDLQWRRFPLVERPGRRLTVSGDGKVTLEAGRVFLRGRVAVDQGRVDLPKLGGPKLSDDVQVAGRVRTEGASQALPLGLDLAIALGNDFRFTGNGLDAWLGGEVRLLADPGEALQARGQIRVDKGRFKAYAQDLDISRGVVSFGGPLDNPTLDVRAVRRFSPVGAGVEISGPVLAPSVKLVADEPMSERDRLSWLVLGRAAAVGEKGTDSGAATAGGLLAGLVNDRVGLFDDVGVLSRNESTAADGTLNPAEQVISLGKQLTRELYVGYEYGLRSAEQAIRLNYQLSRQLSVIGRAGREASGELRYSWRFD